MIMIIIIVDYLRQSEERLLKAAWRKRNRSEVEHPDYDLPHSSKWYEHNSPAGITENEEVKILWDFTIPDREITHCRPDILSMTRTTTKSSS